LTEDYNKLEDYQIIKLKNYQINNEKIK